jgi:hypothetical protein
MEAAHTATPWQVQHVEIGGTETNQLCILSTAECREVATIDHVYSGGERDFAKERAVAEFIERSCNAHNDLVKALQLFVKYDETGDEDGDDDGIAMMMNYADAIKATRTALAKLGLA